MFEVGLKQNIVANYLGTGWTALMNLAFVPLYIRYLGIEAYGLIGVFAMLQGLLSLLDLGMAPTISREMARLNSSADSTSSARTLLRSVEVVSTCIALAMMTGLWLASSWLANDWFVTKNLSIDAVAHALVIMGCLVGLRIIENVYRSAMIGLQKQVLMNLVIGVMATLRGLGAVVVLALVANSIQAFFLWQLTVSAIGIGALAAATYSLLPHEAVPASFSFNALQGVRRFAAGTMAITCISLLLSNMDKILLSRLLSLETFGYYAFAVVVAQTPLGLVNPIAQAFYPRFTQLHSNGQQPALANAYHSAAQLITVLLGTATVFIVMFGHELLEVWTKSAVLSDRIYVIAAILSCGSLFNGLMTIPYYLQLSYGWTGLTVRINAVALVVVVPALLMLVPRYGVTAAAWVWLVLNISYIVVVIPLMHRRLLPREKWHWYVRDVGVPLAAAVLAGLLLRLLSPAHLGQRLEVAALLSYALLLLTVAALAAPIIRARALKMLSWID
ncbi:lipopolysaccharide biosynthesis protein [Dyella lipolytica]|uniref:Oligosaccharide flippase family protein n=1 Tax=Dyella lipolytica TaxID=1867835 RepID=A0ABW8IQR1_9GAMM